MNLRRGETLLAVVCGSGQWHAKPAAKKLKVLLLALLLGLLLPSCRSAAGGDTVVVRTRETRLVRTIPDLVRGDPAIRILDDAALLSAAAYDEAGDVIPVDKCNLSSDEKLRVSLAEWNEHKEWAYPAFTVPSQQQDRSDLYYRVWSTRQSNGTTVVMVVFRGTNFTSLRDWFTNLRYLTRLIPNRRDAYEELLDVAPRLLHAIQERFPNAEIVTAGHSLGGGLAQALAYDSCGRIRTVFAFNSSVVTHKVKALKDCANAVSAIHDLSIYRVYERGEVLFYLRWLFSKFRAISEQVTMLKYDVRTGNTISEHAMQPFACELLRRHAPHESRSEPMK